MGVELVHIKKTHLLFGKFQPHTVMKKGSESFAKEGEFATKRRFLSLFV